MVLRLMKQMHGVAIRPFAAADSAQVQTLLSDSKVALLAGNIPYPYPDQDMMRHNTKTLSQALGDWDN